MMKKLLFLVVFFSVGIAFGQDWKTLQGNDRLEEYTYAILDEFLENPTETNLKYANIGKQNLWRQPKTKQEKLAIVVLLCNTAFYENRYGQLQNAVASYEKAWQLYESNSLSDYDVVEFCLKPLGNLYTVLGDYDNAENTIKQYYYIANLQKNEMQKIAAVLNLSNVYQSSGKTDFAITLLESTFKTTGMNALQKGILYNNLASNYIIANNFEKAKPALEQSIQLLEKLPHQNFYLSNAYRNLASVFSHKKEFKSANSYFKKAKKLFFETENFDVRKRAKLHYDEALLWYEQQNYALAEKAIAEVFKTLIPNYDPKNGLPKQQSLYAETVLLDALDLQAILYFRKNNSMKALESYALSFHIEQLFQTLFVYENTKIVTQLRNRKRTEKCLAIYDLLYRKDQNPAWIEKAFLLSENTKSSVLKTSIADKSKLSSTEKSTLQQLQDWHVAIINEQQKGENASLSKINMAIQKQNELMLLLKSIRTKNPTQKTYETVTKVYQKLHNHKVIMVAYFFGLEKMYVFSLHDHSIEMQVLNSDTAEKTKRFLSYFNSATAIANDASGYADSAFGLYKALQIPNQKGIQNLIVIPDGLLNFVPFEALLTQKTSTPDFSKWPYLLNDFRISYSNSVAFYEKNTSSQQHKKTVFGIFPVFENTPSELAFSKEELKAIQNNFKGKFLQNQQATFQNFKTDAKHFSILHLSTHALAGDLETPASIRFFDREVLYSELYGLDIQPNLVVLSACETGIGKLYNGEGAMSVARGFQFAGAQNLLFSLWKVNDFTTSVVVSDFYQQLKKGKSYAEANRNSKWNYLKNEEIPNAKKSPYYWSAMVYYGSAEEESTFNYFWVLIAIVSGIALFLVFRKIRKLT